MLSQNDVTWGQANRTDMPPDQICKQSWVTNLFLHKHWVNVHLQKPMSFKAIFNWEKATEIENKATDKLKAKYKFQNLFKNAKRFF